MCGIIALLLADEDEHVNQMIFDGLTVLQHRGQDAAGIVTAERSRRLHLRKDNGLVKDVFRTHHMSALKGNVGLGHARYPTAGSSSAAEAQPLYTNVPYGVCLVHNGNLTNTEELAVEVRDGMSRHVNTNSDSELLLNVFAEALMDGRGRGGGSRRRGGGGRGGESKGDEEEKEDEGCSPDVIFTAMEAVMSKCKGGYAGSYLINGVGIVGFRDPHGIRPLVLGSRDSRTKSGGFTDHIIASESVAIDTLGFRLDRDVGPGEAVFVDMRTGKLHSRQCCVHVESMPSMSPCIFEYVYFARPDSIMDGVSVYESRLMMGEKLAEKILRRYPTHDIDVVIPIPDTSRTSALQAAYVLGRPFREGFIKNRYIARTFIMPGQETRKKSVRLKLNCIKSEFAGRNVLLVDDSVVRGTTSREIVEMAREAGARKVYFTSAAPPIRYPNIYGIDIPTREELIAYNRNEEEIAGQMGADWMVYQDLEDLEESVRCCSSEGRKLENFDTSCFSGKYVTGEVIGDAYFTRLHELRNDKAQEDMRGTSSSKKNESKTEEGDGGEAVDGVLSPVVSGMGGSRKPPRSPVVMGSMNGCESVANDRRKDSIGGTTSLDGEGEEGEGRGCESLHQ